MSERGSTSQSSAYDLDPYATRLEAVVRGASRDAKGNYVLLSDTVLYPEGGGQPADRGRIAGEDVIDVQREAGEVRHYLSGPVDRLTPGATVAVELDWRRRFDHMQQHSAQHLLTAIAQERFGWETTAFHLGQRQSDIELDRQGLPAADLGALEEAVNAIACEARPIGVRRVARSELDLTTVRSRALPTALGDVIRLVEIAGVDRCACGGTHVRTTAEIGALKLLSTEAMRGGTRLYFVAGRRLRMRLAHREAQLAALRELMTSPDDQLVEATSDRLAKLKAVERQLLRLGAQLGAARAEVLDLSTEGVIAHHLDGLSMPELLAVAGGLRDKGRIALLSSGGPQSGLFVFVAGHLIAQPRWDLERLGKAVAEHIRGRGGGSGLVYQGKALRLDHRPKAVAFIRSVVSELATDRENLPGDGNGERDHA